MSSTHCPSTCGQRAVVAGGGGPESWAAASGPCQVLSERQVYALVAGR